ncbi:kinesin light chain 3 [Colletotrichum tofieldiae]|uniref:Kinesin light chain 3 n=1 Tax=Colletotrichum tofieldiae TaxID=708197 RepID=A0A166V6B6_9PEZI|nr:kinesin light chain 3 [Colletotrichum tofieldiae]
MGKKSLGEEHPNTVASITNLAATYTKEGRLGEAEKLQTYALETMKKVLGKDHFEIETSMSSLAAIYKSQARFEEAEELGLQAVGKMKRVLGEGHATTLTSMANLAHMYKGLGRGQWKKAEVMELQVLEMSLRVLGEEHPDTVASMNNLAHTRKDLGRWRDATELGETAGKEKRGIQGARRVGLVIVVIIRAMANLPVGVRRVDKCTWHPGCEFMNDHGQCRRFFQSDESTVSCSTLRLANSDGVGGYDEWPPSKPFGCSPVLCLLRPSRELKPSA